MPDRTFIETYPLYRKFELEFPEGQRLSDLPKPSTHMHCEICDSEQTFILWLQYGAWDHAQNRNQNERFAGRVVVEVIYICSSCTQFRRHFLLRFDPAGQYVMKVGQEPAWDISIDRALEKALGDRVEYYKKGLINESQGYGIGAFAYYRRVVEEIIGELLTEIGDLLAGEEHKEYLSALEKVKQSRVAQDKIAFVKDLLPPILRPGNMNPLSTLHSILSEGLHEQDDEACINRAAAVREALEFLVSQVSARKAAARKYTNSMRVLLGHKSENESSDHEEATPPQSSSNTS